MRVRGFLLCFLLFGGVFVMGEISSSNYRTTVTETDGGGVLESVSYSIKTVVGVLSGVIGSSTYDMGLGVFYGLGDTVAPILQFIYPTPEDGERVVVDWVYVNVSSSDASEHSVFLDWNRSLVGWWSFDYMNSTGVFDNSTWGNFGIFGGGLAEGDSVTGKRGEGLEFDGAGDYVDMDDNIDSFSSLASGTIVAWFKWNSEERGTIFSISNGNAQSTEYELGVDDYASQVCILHRNDAVGQINVCKDSVVNDSLWHHIAFSVDSSGNVFYLDGNASGTTYYTGAASTSYFFFNIVSADNVGIGANTDSGGAQWFFNGTIDEVQIYDRALSAAEVNASFDAGSYRLEANFTGLSEGVYDYKAWAIDETGNVGSAERNVTINSGPNNVTPVLVSTDGLNLTTSDLNCSGIVSDINGDDLNVSVRWYKDDVLNLSLDYNENYVNGTLFSAILDSGNTSKGENWSCSIRTYDDALYSDWVISSELEILNSVPDNITPVLVSTDGLNLTTSDLNCSGVLSDDNLDNMNVSVRWYKNSVLTLSFDYNENYANGSLFNAILDSGNTSSGENWKCSVRVYDGVLYSDWVNSSELGVGNSAPYDTAPTLVSVDDLNLTTSDLNCSSVVSDVDGDDLNVSVRWYKDDVLNLTLEYNNYANASLVSSILGSGNTSRGEDWLCSMRLYDGNSYSNWVNSSALTILNSLPTVTLDSPSDWSAVTNRTSEFNWTGYDADGDSLTYEISISEYKYAGSDICNDDILDDNVGVENYVPTNDLLCLYDNGYYYNWSVRANDSYGWGEWSDVWHVNVTAEVAISLALNEISFGSIGPGDIEDTSDGTPSPFEVDNDGNVLTNVSVNSTALWDMQSGDSSYYQFKVDNVTGEEGAFSWLKSITSWFNMTITGEVVAVAELEYPTGDDSVEVDVRLEVPSDEYPGVKSATIIFTGELAE